MAPKKKSLLSGVVGIAVVLALQAAVARADKSSWSASAALIDANDTSYACIPVLSGSTSGHLRSSFRKLPSDSNVATTNDAVHTGAAQAARVSCYATSSRTGTPTVITTALSTDGGGDIVQGDCPGTKPYGAYPQCRIEAANTTWPYVYQGSSCGNGITSIQGSAGAGSKVDFIGQLMGPYFYLQPPPGFTFPQSSQVLFNQTLLNPHVNGSDIATMFLARGTLYYAFGDVDIRDFQAGDPPRTNVLFYGTDMNASDGLTFSGWDADASTGIAKENILSFHNNGLAPGQGQGIEDSAIPGSGFALTAADGTHYRYLWYASVDWDGGASGPNPAGSHPLIMHASLARSLNGAAWIRGDGLDPTKPPVAASAPVWPWWSSFGTGAVWFDRWNRTLYFFGTQNAGSGIRVARVASTPTAIADPTKYDYWAGPCVFPLVAGINCDWVRDGNGDFLEGAPQAAGGYFSTAADIIPATATELPRLEISVAFNSFTNRFTMMLLNVLKSQIEYWQSPAITGPWTKLSADSQLPTYDPTVPNTPYASYAPMMSEHIMRNAGKDTFFLLSEFYPAYDPGIWHLTANRSTISNCSLDPAPP